MKLMIYSLGESKEKKSVLFFGTVVLKEDGGYKIPSEIRSSDLLSSCKR